MKQIAQFFTLFWIIYFPTSIAFYEDLPYQWFDEAMTVVLMGFTLLQYGKKRITNTKPWKEYFLYLLVLVFFIFYSLSFGANVQAAVWRDMVQWIRPFSVIYCTWILNPRFSKRQKNWMLWSMIATLLLWAIQHPMGRVVNANGELVMQEFVVLGQMAMCTGMAWYIFKKGDKRNRNIAIFIMALGMLAPKFKYLGELVCAVGLMVYSKKLNFKSAKTLILLGIMIAVVLTVTWTKFDAYYVSGFAEDAERMARPETYRVAFTQILWEYFPFGSGMGSWGCAAAADYYSPLYYKYNMDDIWGLDPENPMFLADAFYPVLAQIGVAGILLFCWFWKRRLVAFNQIRDMRYYRVAWITFFCLAIEQTADTSFLSGKGMGFCMLIALCLNANRNQGFSDNGKKKTKAIISHLTHSPERAK